MANGNGNGFTLDRRFTWGNIATIIVIIVQSAIWYAKMNDHVEDSNVHQTQAIQTAAFDDRFSLKMAPIITRVEMRQEFLERRIAELSNEIRESQRHP